MKRFNSLIRALSRLLLLLLCLTCWAHQGQAQQAHMIDDINRCPTSIGFFNLIILNSDPLLSARFPGTGAELTRIENGKPVLVKDIESGPADSNIRMLFRFQGKAYFLATTKDNGEALWRSDGTATGTELWLDVTPGPETSGTISSFQLGDTFFAFVISSGDSSQSLWISDGTLQNTVRSNQSDRGQLLSQFNFIGAMPNEIYLSAGKELFDGELYKIDASRTLKLVKDIIPGQAASRPRGLTMLDSRRAVFFATENTGAIALYSTDGTEAGTQLALSFGTANGSLDLKGTPIGVGSKVYFLSAGHNKPKTLWATDGTMEGTGIIYPPAGTESPANILFRGSLHGRLVFCPAYGLECEPWITDGTEQGTHLIKDISPAESETYVNSFLSLPSIPGKAFFAARDRDRGIELFVSDGTAPGTTLLKDILPGFQSSYPSTLFSANGKLNFFALSPQGIALFESDGTEAGTVYKNNLATGVTESSTPTSAQFLPNGDILFFARRCQYEYDPYVFRIADGKIDRITDPAVVSDGKLEFLGKVGNLIYFQRNVPGIGAELWKTDGTSAGTSLVKDINSGAGSSDPSGGSISGNRLLFFADDGTHGIQLWTTDGTTQGTTLLKDGFLEMAPQAESEVTTRINGKNYFLLLVRSENNPVRKQLELWSSDGSSSGTQRVSVIGDSTTSISSPRAFVFQNKLYFHAFSETEGFEPWISDGTATGTKLLKDIAPGQSRSSPSRFLEVAGKLIFAANPGGRFLLFSTDGTGENTRPWLPANVLADSTIISPLAKFGEKLLFSASTPSSGNELWISDGTENGTRMLKDIAEGSENSNPSNVLVTGGVAFFRTIIKNRQDLWVTDGTPEGTMRAVDFGSSGGMFNAPLIGTPLGLLFSASDGTHGLEPYLLTQNDFCPTDDLKNFPGKCGCNVADADTDQDGTVDCLDACPADPKQTTKGSACGCSDNSLDKNGNGIPDCQTVEDLKQVIRQLKRALKKVKLAGEKATKKQLLRAKNNVRLFRKQLLGLITQVSFASSYTTVLSDPTTLATIKRLKSADRRFRKSLRANDSTKLKKNRRAFLRTLTQLETTVQSIAAPFTAR